MATLSDPVEVLRGLGYWFFYGTDKLGPWTEPSATYTTNVAVLALSYAIPLAAIVAAAVVRWRYRALFLTIVVVGALTAVAAYPWSNPSLVGAAFKAFTRTDAGLSLRSTPRAVPLVALGLALFLGAAVSAIGRRLPRLTLPMTGLAAVVLFANLPTALDRRDGGPQPRAARDDPAVLGRTRPPTCRAATTAPGCWSCRAPTSPATGGATRSTRSRLGSWTGRTWPGSCSSTDRPSPPHCSTPWTGACRRAPSTRARSRRSAAVMGAGDVVHRGDLQYERFRTPRPRQMWDILVHAPGLGPILGFGPTTPNVAGPEQPLIDETALGADPSLVDPPAVGVLNVQEPEPIVRTHAATGSLLMAGDAEGMVDSAAEGLIKPTQGSFFAASYAQDPAGFQRIYDGGADLLVTDTNRKRAERWGTIREQFGYTERADEVAPYDPTDQRLEVFPGQSSADQTVTEQRGGAVVTATAYGNPVTYTPDDRPANAMDGDPASSWRVGAIDDPIGQRLIIDLAQPVTTDHLTLLQPLNLVRNRYLTKVRLHFDDQPPVEVALGPESRQEPGQVVTFPQRTFHHLEIEVVETNIAKRPYYDGVSGVGFAEVGIDGVHVDELVRPPTDLLDQAGASSIDHRLSVVFTRLRSNPAEPVRLDEETRLNRLLTLPTSRSFGLVGTARLSDYVPDALIDQLLGLPSAAQGGITVETSAHLPGAITHRGSAALDGDPSTSWTGRFQTPTGEWIQTTFAAPRTIDHLDLQLVADGQHSVPTELTIEPDGDASRAVVVPLPAVSDGTEPGAVAAAPVQFPAITGTTFRFTVTGARTVQEKDWYSNGESAAPVAIAELGIPGSQVAAPAAAFDSGCRADLLTVDGQPVPLRVTGTSADAVERKGLTVAACSPDPTITMGPGEHVVRTAIGRQLGIDIDQLALASDRGGAAISVADQAAAPTEPSPDVTTVHAGRVSYDLQVDKADAPFWLAVGQSWSDGWHASINGKAVPPPQVIDGYGNGWLIDPHDYGAGPLSIHVEWTPQKIVWVAVGLSAVGVLACLALALLARRRSTPALDEVPGRPIDPRLAGLRHRHRGSSWRAAIIAGVTMAGFVALTSPLRGLGLPLLVVAAAGLTAASFRWERGRGVLALAAAAALGAAAGYTVASQAYHHYLADFTWPTQFAKVADLGLLAVFLLLGEAARDLVVPTEERRLGSPES